MLAKCMNWSVCSKLLCGGQKLWTDVVHMCPGRRSSMSKKLRAYIRSHGRLCPGLAREAGRAPLHPPRLPPSQRLPTGSHASSPSRTLLWQPTLLRSKSAIYILKLLCRSAKALEQMVVTLCHKDPADNEVLKLQLFHFFNLHPSVKCKVLENVGGVPS